MAAMQPRWREELPQRQAEPVPVAPPPLRVRQTYRARDGSPHIQSVHALTEYVESHLAPDMFAEPARAEARPEPAQPAAVAAPLATAVASLPSIPSATVGAGAASESSVE